MKKMRIGVWDEEKEYVSRLAAFLQRFGNGRWEVFAFTEAHAVQVHLHKDSLDMLIGTDKEGLREYEHRKDMIKLWLTEDKEKKKVIQEDWHILYRFQRAEVFGNFVNKIFKEKQQNEGYMKKLIAMYSPVGRCGKTTLALNFIRESEFLHWLYIGLEDYSSSGEEHNKQLADEMLYYWKERKEEQLKKLFEENQVIVTGNSFFDIRQLESFDFVWLRQMLEMTNIKGILFDIGSGILQDFQMLKVFDEIIVPYVEEEGALNKKNNFECLFTHHNMEECREHLHYIDMARKPEQTRHMRDIFGGVGL